MALNRKLKIGILFCLMVFSLMSDAQERCISCKVDSLKTQIEKNPKEKVKIKLLSQLVDFELLYGFESYGISIKYLNNLVALSKNNSASEFEAYVYWYKGRNANEAKKIDSALYYTLHAIDAFDQIDKPIPQLLLFVRILYNNLNKQEERRQFYNRKIVQYSLNGRQENLAASYHGLGGYYNYTAEYNLAISNYLKAGNLFKSFDKVTHVMALSAATSVYADWGNLNKSFEYSNMVLPMAKIVGDSLRMTYLYMTLADLSLRKGKFKEAILYADSCKMWEGKNKDGKRIQIIKSINELILAIAYLNKNDPTQSHLHILEAEKLANSLKLDLESTEGSFEIDFVRFKYYRYNGNSSKAEAYLQMAYQKAKEAHSNKLQLIYLQELALFYSGKGDFKKAWNYDSQFFELSRKIDSVNSSFKIAQYEIDYKELQQNDSINKLKQKQAIQAAVIKQSNIWLWILFFGILLVSVSLYYVYRQFRINQQNLIKLQATQKQLMLAEKMASLGELTAGIAHEIQNPLNFVNNFSEISKELVDEMLEALDNGNISEAKDISNDVKENLDKIHHHGKRADGIVKGMLQHSSNNSGQKELTNLNLICDEFLKLSYHGLRAKDKNFNAQFFTELDPAIGKVSIQAQGFGRVVLNLVNNAFYAVNEKNKQFLKDPSSIQLPVGQTAYEPTVSISTKKQMGKVVIEVKDNGTGIPQKVIDKIFQPFFTTKPTGEGTGLGLGLSYDIITNGHNGTLVTETKEGEGTSFIITIPI